MSTKNSKSKHKKPLETTLGKAPSCHSAKDVDYAHLRKPIATSVLGLKQIFNLFQNSTEEIQNYISHECDLMFECRTCRTIFRSLANFILHKRSYCLGRFNPVHELRNDPDDEEEIEMDNETPYSRPTSPEEGKPKKTIAEVTRNLLEKREMAELAQKVLTEDLSSEADSKKEEKSTGNAVVLEPIETNKCAVFQTAFNVGKDNLKEYMKSEVMEIHGIVESDEAVLGPDGKICRFKTDKRNEKPNVPKTNLYCPECDLKFSTRKTLTSHIKYKHNNTRLMYVCPICKETYANAWCVFRHLCKVHRKSTVQIRRLREQVINNVTIRKEHETTHKDKKPSSVAERLCDENQWMDNIEGDNDLQMCGGCGKRFERKAALHSHSQMCAKRIAVCNTLKENAKKKESDEKDLKKPADLKLEKTVTVKGSAKRKPALLRTYKVPDEEILEEPVVEELDGESKPSTVEEELSCSSNTTNDTKVSCDVNANNKKLLLGDLRPLSLFSDSDDDSRKSLSLDRKEKLDSMDTESMMNIIGIASDFSKTQINTIVMVDDDNQEVATEEMCNNSPDDTEDFPSTSNSNAPGSDSEEPETIFPKFDLPECLISQSEETVEIEMNHEPSPPPAALKRKRTLSFDGFSSNKITKLSDLKGTPSRGGDVNFICKANAYMDRDKLLCIPCELTYASLSQLLWHMSMHFSWFRFQCSKCYFMTFNKYDCAQHAKQKHNVTNDFMSGVVLPIPNWKTLLMSHDFIPIEPAGLNATQVEVDIPQDEFSCNSDVTDSSAGLANDTTKGQEYTDESSVDTNPSSFPANIPDILNDLNKDCEIITEVIVEESAEDLDNENDPLAPTEETSEESPALERSDVDAIQPSKRFKECDNEVHSFMPVKRSVRNRTKSVKIIQDDFLYDMRQVLKIHEAAKSPKTLKKASMKKSCANSKLGKTLAKLKKS